MTYSILIACFANALNCIILAYFKCGTFIHIQYSPCMSCSRLICKRIRLKHPCGVLDSWVPKSRPKDKEGNGACLQDCVLLARVWRLQLQWCTTSLASCSLNNVLVSASPEGQTSLSPHRQVAIFFTAAIAELLPIINRLHVFFECGVLWASKPATRTETKRTNRETQRD